MKIQPITERAYTTAKLTLDAMRQELLYYREDLIPALHEQIRDMEKQIIASEQKRAILEGELKELRGTKAEAD